MLKSTPAQKKYTTRIANGVQVTPKCLFTWGRAKVKICGVRRSVSGAKQRVISKFCSLNMYLFTWSCVNVLRFPAFSRAGKNGTFTHDFGNVHTSKYAPFCFTAIFQWSAFVSLLALCFCSVGYRLKGRQSWGCPNVSFIWTTSIGLWALMSDQRCDMEDK